MYNNKMVKVVYKTGIERVVKADYFQNVILRVKALKENVFTYSYNV